MNPHSHYIEQAREIVAQINWGDPKADVETIAEALSNEAKREREQIACKIERLSPYFDESPEACYQVCVNDVAKMLRKDGEE